MCAGILNVIAQSLLPGRNLGFWFTGLIAGAVFLKQILAYLRPKIPVLWAALIYVIDAAVILLPFFLIRK